MKIKRSYWFLLVGGLVAIAGLVLFWRQPSPETSSAPAMHAKKPSPGGRAKRMDAAPVSASDKVPTGTHGAKAAATPDGAENEVAAAQPESLTEEERREREEEKQVDAFDALTDKWMEPAKGGVTMKEVDAFIAQFKKVPKARKEECLQRALNLVPDENVMLLAGILMDKSQDRDLIELVYNDVLNRDEDVKKPILQQIFADKEHPCWADTAWILDVTGELPQKK